MDYMNESGSCQFKPLDVVNHLGLWMTLMIRAQLVYLEFGPQIGVINKIYNLYHHALG